jgi:hypothetical protein
MAVTAEGLRSFEGQKASAKKRERGPVVLTPRDRELLVHLALARHLSADQIGRLVFAGKTDSIVRRRLCRLASGKHAYVRRVPFRTRDGVRTVVWSLGSLGYLAARNLFGEIPDRPVNDPGAEFLEREVGLNELYVGLAAAASRKRVPLDRRPFRWLSSDSARLPWTEFDAKSKSPASRLIRPDTTVEMLEPKRRIFIELETGPLGLHRDNTHGRDALKLKAKIDRYVRFLVTPLSSLLNETFYLRAFSDGWPAELLFLVRSATRRDDIADNVASTWRPTNDRVPFTIRALTLDEAPAALCDAAKLSLDLPSLSRASPATSETLTCEEIRALYDFYNGAIAAIAAVRQFAKNNPQLARRVPVPEYPANHQTVKQICLRLAETLQNRVSRRTDGA